MAWEKLPAVLRQAMREAAGKPGRYGGRYVGRRYNPQTEQDDFEILDDDDPDKIRNDSEDDLDVLAQAMPTKIHPIGSARNYINTDGTVEFHNADGTVERHD